MGRAAEAAACLQARCRSGALGKVGAAWALGAARRAEEAGAAPEARRPFVRADGGADCSSRCSSSGLSAMPCSLGSCKSACTSGIRRSFASCASSATRPLATADARATRADGSAAAEEGEQEEEEPAAEAWV